jgi:hypothetical protein
MLAENSQGGQKNTTGSLSDLGIVREDSEHDDSDDAPRSDRKQRTRSA